MMKNVVKAFATCALVVLTSVSFAASLFGDKDIEIVKSGVLKWNQSVSLGSFMDSQSMRCANKRWSKFTASNGATVVEFKCNLNNDMRNLEGIKTVKRTPASEKIYNAVPFIIDGVTSVYFKAQFLVNADKSGFRVGFNDICVDYNDGTTLTKVKALYNINKKQRDFGCLFYQLNGQRCPAPDVDPREYNMLKLLMQGEVELDGERGVYIFDDVASNPSMVDNFFVGMVRLYANSSSENARKIPKNLVD